MRDVILPQAFKIALAPTVGYMVQIIKGTSLAAIIGFVEITRSGQIINNATFQPLIVFSVVASIYFVLCWPLSLLAARMERRQLAALAR
jgi:polar amino acid transport system permease protein